MRVLEAVVGAVSASVLILTDPNVLAAVVSVLWRAEDLVAVPVWIRWLVLVGLVVVAFSAINRRLRTERR